jgi:hypothetical protein
MNTCHVSVRCVSNTPFWWGLIATSADFAVREAVRVAAPVDATAAVLKVIRVLLPYRLVMRKWRTDLRSYGLLFTARIFTLENFVSLTKFLRESLVRIVLAKQDNDGPVRSDFQLWSRSHYGS